MTQPGSAVDIVQRFNDAFNRHDLDAIMALMSDAGDRCVVRWVYSWVKDGTRGHVRGVDVFRVRDGLVAEKMAPCRR